MRVAIDTNVLVYAESVNGTARRDQALDVLSRHEDDEILLPVQVLAELYAVLTRKAHVAPESARTTVLQWTDAFSTIPTRAETLADAMELVVSHRLALWDAVILAASAEAQARVLLSEDFQAGFTWRGVTVDNPFASSRGG